VSAHPLSRRRFLELTGASGLALTLPCRPGAETEAPPNIIAIVVDDLHWDDIGAADHPFVQTPHIDRLAREGARFANAFSTTPLCSPSRASLLTGLHAHAHGVTDNTDHSPLTHRLATFPRDLQAAGYETAFIGKWHMGVDETARPGFDYWAAMRGQGEAHNPHLNEGGGTRRVEGYVTDVLTDRAVRFIERDRDRPFMLFLAHKAIHPNVLQRADGSVAAIRGGGFIPADRHRGMYADAAIPRGPSFGVPPADKPALWRRLSGVPDLGPDTATSDTEIRDRLEMLMAVDDGLGRILESLERRGELDNTAIAFTSDHGYFYGEHGLSAERRLAYEETIRIPLLMRYPRLIEAGAVPRRMALTIDLAPTFLELAGVAVDRPLHGRSLVPLLRGQTESWRRSLLVQYYSDTVFPRIRSMGYRAVRTGRARYIRYGELAGMDELYDLAADPYELRNLITAPEAGPMLKQMQAELERLVADTR